MSMEGSSTSIGRGSQSTVCSGLLLKEFSAAGGSNTLTTHRDDL
jgi:hypothetical protein